MSPSDSADPFAADDEDTAETDGGPSMDRAKAFTTETEYSTSRGQELRELYDRKFYAPVQIMMNDYRGIFGMLILLLYILMGTVGVALYPRPSQSTNYLVPWFETMEYPLGTDVAGRDLLGMVIWATPAMLQLMLGGALFAISLSVAIGTIAGYKRGLTDRVLMTITDVAMTLPGLPLLIVLIAVLQPTNPFLIGIILSINAWAGGARSIRSQVLQIRKSDYVEASRAMGVSAGRNVQKNVIPELLPMIAMTFMSSLVGILYAAVGLYFLGIMPTEQINWGVMLNTAYTEVDFNNFTNFHYLIVPLFAISLFGVGTVYVAQAFDRVFNPRLRAKHAKTIRGGSDDDNEETVDAGTVGGMVR